MSNRITRRNQSAQRTTDTQVHKRAHSEEEEGEKKSGKKPKTTKMSSADFEELKQLIASTSGSIENKISLSHKSLETKIDTTHNALENKITELAIKVEGEVSALKLSVDEVKTEYHVNYKESNNKFRITTNGSKILKTIFIACNAAMTFELQAFQLKKTKT